MAGARRVDVTEDIQDLGRHEYSSAFAVTVIPRTSSPPEQWARAAFEQAPRALGSLVWFGWKHLLRFQLGPRSSPSHVLGWKIVGRAPGEITLEVRSVLLTAHKVVRVEDSRVIMTTFVRYERQMGRFVWSAIAPVHHRTEPYLLGRAAGSGAEG